MTKRPLTDQEINQALNKADNQGLFGPHSWKQRLINWFFALTFSAEHPVPVHG